MNVSGLTCSPNNKHTTVAYQVSKKYRLGILKCLDHDIFTLQQSIRLQHFERGNEKVYSPKQALIVSLSGRMVRETPAISREVM